MVLIDRVVWETLAEVFLPVPPSRRILEVRGGGARAMLPQSMVLDGSV